MRGKGGRHLGWTAIGVVFFAMLPSGAIFGKFPSQENAAGSAASSALAPYATPEGITIQPLGVAQGYALSKATATVLPREKILYADGRGMTLYFYEKDSPNRSACVDECAKTWIPFHPVSSAKPYGDWSIIVRSDGTKQWAYRTKPLYTFVEDKEIGSVGGNAPSRFGRGPSIGPRGRSSSDIPADKPLPENWTAAVLFPVSGLELPTVFVVREVGDVPGIVLTDSVTGLTLYAFEGGVSKAENVCKNSDLCNQMWRPFVAPRLAKPIGDFSLAARNDGSSQWMFKGRALFTNENDQLPGDAAGVGIDSRWTAAVLERYFLPAGVRLGYNPKLGKLLTTSEGKTLYRRNSYIWQTGGGHGLRRGDTIRPAVGRDLGTDPRCQTECEKWHPFLAPANALPWGDWSVATRSDGTRQWVQKGYALWTYDGDLKPTDVNGNDVYEIFSTTDPQKVLDIGTPYDGPPALYWIAAYY